MTFQLLLQVIKKFDNWIRRPFFLYFLFCTGSIAGLAQEQGHYKLEFGIKATRNRIEVANNLIGARNIYGNNAEIFLGKNLGKDFSFIAGLSIYKSDNLIQHGFATMPNFIAFNHARMSRINFEIPLLVKYHLLDYKIKVRPKAGVRFNMAREQVTVTSFQDPAIGVQVDRLDDSFLDFSFEAGVEIGYELFPQVEIFLEGLRGVILDNSRQRVNFAFGLFYKVKS